MKYSNDAVPDDPYGDNMNRSGIQPGRPRVSGSTMGDRRLRHPPAGGYARGHETRLRIIQAAIGLFGEYGFGGASTRDIVARAGVSLPALQYYFNSKEGLYRACAEFISDETWERFEPVVGRARAVLDSRGNSGALVEAFIGIQDAIADQIFTVPCAPVHRLFFAGEQSGNEQVMAAQILNKRVKAPLKAVMAALVARITGVSADDPLTRIRTVVLCGPLMLFQAAPRSTLAWLGWQDIDAHQQALIRTTVHAQTRTLLQLWRSGNGDGEMHR
jgi:TetR/AcrR family transcriptional regulator, regulator of cefoperazone and chloramphenicol sensitivity